MNEDPEIGAYVDGELDATAARAFEARLQQDPALAAEVARHQALRARLNDAFAPILDAEVPARLVAAVNAPLAPRRGGWTASQWAAMAACLLVGVLVGRGIVDQGPLRAGGDGALVARGMLAQALSSQLAADQSGHAVQVGLSFKTARGNYCRTFQDARANLAGVACREDGRWVARLTQVHEAAATPSQTYRTAGATTPPAVLAAVDSMISGEPLDQDGERAARAKGWTN